MKKKSSELIAILAKYFVGKYDAAKSYITELTLMHAVEVTSAGGGEMALNDANTKVLVGVSDFNGTAIPSSASGLLRAISVKYGSVVSTAKDFEADPAGQKYSEVKADFPAWLLNSEIIVRANNVEHIRTRVSETVLLQASQLTASEFAKELVKTIKVVGAQDLQIFLATPKGSTLDNTKKHFVRVDLYGLSFGERKAN